MKSIAKHLAGLGLLAATATHSVMAADLSSWHQDGAATQIKAYVEQITEPGTQHYVAPQDRIAVFDNDGTLWAEKPVYTEVIFALSMAKELAANHPEWKNQEPFSLVLEQGVGALKTIGLSGAIEVLTAVYADLDQAQLAAAADKFLASPHPTTDTSFGDAIYAPMLELIDYLQDNEFKVFIVSGGTSDFLRTFASDTYGVERSRIIGTAPAIEVVDVDGKLVIKRQPKLAYFNDKQMKVLNIRQDIGQRPLIAVGNSDGDLAMMRYATEGDIPGLAVLLQHDDEVRETSYNKGADQVQALAAERSDWVSVSMKGDFKHVFGQ